MELYRLLFYFGLTFTLAQIIKLFPFKTALWPKILQQFILFTIHVIVIFFIPRAGVASAAGLFIITVLFTLIADGIKTRFYQGFFTCYIEQCRLPELIYLLNWDFHSLALVKTKKLFSALEQNNKEEAAGILDQLKKYPGLDQYPLWRQDLLQILHYTQHNELAKSLINTWKINLDKPGTPYGLVSIIMNINLTDNNFEAAYGNLVYLITHYRDAQHRLLNLMNILIFYAQAGATVEFNRHLSAYPELLKNPVVKYWQNILLLRTGRQEEAIRMLYEFKQGLTAPLEYFGHYVDKLLENPGYYSQVTDVPVPAAVGILPSQPLPAALPKREKKTSGIPVYVLCAIIAVITLAQFLLAGPASLQDFILQPHITNYDYIQAGAYSYPLVQAGQWIRLATAVFLHGNWLHLLLNLYGLFVIGRFIVRTYGTWQFYFLFLFSGIMANLISHFIDKFPIGVGASGGVFGLLAAMLVYIFRNRKSMSREQFYRFLVNFAVIIGINIVYGMQNKMINNTAHLAGLISGGLAALGYVYLIDKIVQMKKICDTAIMIVAILISALTLGLWPTLLSYDYPGKTALNRPGNIEGFSYQAAAAWEKISDKRFMDRLVGGAVFIDNAGKPESLYPAAGTADIEAYIREQEELILAAGNKDNKWLLNKQVSALANGWYVFILSREQRTDPLNYKLYYYVKRFTTSLCTVYDYCPGKYAEQYQNLIIRFLSTIKETNGF